MYQLLGSVRSWPVRKPCKIWRINWMIRKYKGRSSSDQLWTHFPRTGNITENNVTIISPLSRLLISHNERGHILEFTVCYKASLPIHLHIYEINKEPIPGYSAADFYENKGAPSLQTKRISNERSSMTIQQTHTHTIWSTAFEATCLHTTILVLLNICIVCQHIRNSSYHKSTHNARSLCNIIMT